MASWISSSTRNRCSPSSESAECGSSLAVTTAFPGHHTGPTPATSLEGQAGEVAEGFLADLLVVAGEPQKDVRLLQAPGNIKLVMKDGQIYKNLLSIES